MADRSTQAPVSSVAAAESESDSVLVVRAIDKTSCEPLPGVRVSVMPSGIHVHSSTHVAGSRGALRSAPLSGADGRAEFDLPSGVELEISAWGEEDEVGHGSRRVPALSPGERRELELELPTGNDLHYFGQVLSREDKAPVIARIQVHNHATDALLKERVTDPDGRFELWLPSWKDLDIRIEAQGFARVLLHVERAHEAPEKARVVLLARSATLRARLLDARGGVIADGAVLLWTESYRLGESDHGQVYAPSTADPIWRGSTDDSGLCVLQDLPPDVPFHVEILRAGKTVRRDLLPLSFHPGEVHEIEWRLGSGCLIEGAVVDQLGRVVTERRMWLQRAEFDAPTFFRGGGAMVVETSTDSLGRFAFTDVSAGTWWIGPAPERDDWDAPDPEGIAAVGRVVEVVEGSSRQEIRVEVHRGLYIRGAVVDPAGGPRPEDHVYAFTEAAAYVCTESALDATFALGPLIPGRYSLVAHGRGHADSEPVEANAGDEGVLLRLRAGGSMSGRVVEGTTGDGCEAKLVFALDDSPVGFGLTGSARDGAFQFDGLLPGTYSLVASASGMRAGILRGIPVKTGLETDELVVTLAAGAMLRLKYAGTAGYMQYRIRSDGSIIAGDGVAARACAEAVVPPGRVLVECAWPQGAEEQEIELAAGEEKELVFGEGERAVDDDR